jgi:D-alanyl-D-alanine carboxypeptidase
MSKRNLVWSGVIAGLALALAPLIAQQVVTGGPPPEIRALVDGVMKGINGGSAQAWEAMAKERFATDLLEKQSAQERQAIYDKLHADFGTVTVDRVMRRGPDAPLELQVKGSTGSTGVITLDITESSPLRISSLRVQQGEKEEEPPAGGPPMPPITGRMTTEALGRALDAYLSALTAADQFSGVALVANGEATVFEKAYGLADRANRIPNTTRTRFNIGSINKTFTRMAIDRLVAQGRVKYGDTLGALIPDYPQAMSRPATVAQLLDHTAGLADLFGPEFSAAAKDRFRSNADCFSFISSLPPLFAPGARNQYCNGCYIALGAIIARVAGVPYERYVTDQIFTPAGMAATGFLSVDGIEPDLAVGYTRRGGDDRLRSNVLLHGAAGSAAGGSHSTTGDLLAFVKAQRDGRLPRSSGMTAIAGGAPGVNAILQSEGTWTVIVLTNLDPPTGERIGGAIMARLADAR